MCGVIGFTSPDTTYQDLCVVRRVMIESRIRGKHASGIAWSDSRSIHSEVRAIPIDELAESFDFHKLLKTTTKVSLIAHARYSTSNILFNQPIVGVHHAIAHNGVITQASPDSWEKTYGYHCNTENDSELLLRCIENDDNPYQVFPDSSYAAIVLNHKGELSPFRNGLRPLWSGTIGKGTVFASTYDILNRAGVSNISQVITFSEDLQRRNWNSWKTHKNRIT